MEETELINLINQERIAPTSDFHGMCGRKWRLYGEKKLLHFPIVYSAFEFRMSMERYLLELLLLIKKSNLNKKEMNNDFSQLVKAIYKTKGKDGKKKLKKHIYFNYIYNELIPIEYRPYGSLAIVDIEKVNKYWNKLNKYCHRQLETKNTWDNKKWVIDGYKLLNEVENYLWETMVNKSIAGLEKINYLLE